MASDSNPYEAAERRTPAEPGATFIAVAVGVAVFLFSFMIMLAFLFGITVAVAGQNQPAPVNAAQLITGRSGVLLGAGLFGIFPVAVLLGVFSSARVLRVQRNLLEADRRRMELRDQLEQLRQSQVALKNADTPGVQE